MNVIPEILCTALALVLFLAVIAVHEYAHTAEMLRARLDVAEVAVGFGPLLYSRTLASGTKLSLRLLPLGGYTKPRDMNEFARLDASDQIQIDAAGVWVNLA